MTRVMVVQVVRLMVVVVSMVVMSMDEVLSLIMDHVGFVSQVSSCPIVPMTCFLQESKGSHTHPNFSERIVKWIHHETLKPCK